MPSTRPPAVAGLFYPADAATLARAVDDLVAAAAARQGDVSVPKALIVPHAGYLYSGAVAASAYARLAPAREHIRRVLLLGPVHRVPVRGLALPGVTAFESPLGAVPIDVEAAARIRSLPQIVESRAAHQQEHSLEVHLPFLQRTLASFRLLPFAVGDATAEEVAEVLDRFWSDDETLIVVSSDLSHYLPYEAARAVDAQTAAMIVDRCSDVSHERACGGTPINGLLLTAQRRGCEVALIDLRNSGDTAGSRERVVGYAAFAVGELHVPGEERGHALIGIARGAIGERLGAAAVPMPAASWLHQPGAAFVTLQRLGVLRGCIGSLEPSRPLGTDVRENALGAAFLDPRFQPLTSAEWTDTRVEVSLLSGLEALVADDEAVLLRSLRPGLDGLVLRYGHHRATFLPQVWEQLPEPEAFLLNLKRKAGLPPDFWEVGLRLSRYTVHKWREQDFA